MTYEDLVEWQESHDVDDATMLSLLCDMNPDAIDVVVAAYESKVDGQDEEDGEDGEEG